MRILLRSAMLSLMPLLAWAGTLDLSPEAAMQFDTVNREHEEAVRKAGEPVTKLSEKYIAALEKRKSAAQAAGQLDLVISIDSAISAVGGGGLPNINAKDAELTKLTKIYLSERSRLNTSIKPALDASYKKRNSDLAALVASLTKAGKIEDAKRVREELNAIDPSAVEIALMDLKKWEGVWEVNYDNNNTRRLRIEAKDGKTLKVAVLSGTWEPGARYTARYDEGKKGFLAEQVANEGVPPRCEVYTLDGEIMRIRHWIAGKDSYERPTALGTAKLAK